MLAPFVERHVGEQFRRRYSGVVEQNIGAAEFREHTAAGVLNRLLVGDIGLNHQRALPGFLYGMRGRIELADIAANKREIGAGFRQCDRRRLADTASGAGDDSDIPFEAEQRRKRHRITSPSGHRQPVARRR